MAVLPEIALDCGVTIHLDCLFQYQTYGGLLMGLPNKKLNAELIESALKYASERSWMQGTPHLLAPREISMGIPKNEWMRQDDAYEPMELPAIVSIATFDSFKPARDPNADTSSLIIVWFQNTFGPPVDPETLRQFRSIDWHALATDGSW